MNYYPPSENLAVIMSSSPPIDVLKRLPCSASIADPTAVSTVATR
jgi:hypothetical protein